MKNLITNTSVLFTLLFSQLSFARLPDISQNENVNVALTCFQERTTMGDLGIDFNLSLDELAYFLEPDFAQDQMETFLIVKQFNSTQGKNRFAVSVSRTQDQIDIQVLGVDDSQYAKVTLQKDANGDFKGLGHSRINFSEGSVECEIQQRDIQK